MKPSHFRKTLVVALALLLGLVMFAPDVEAGKKKKKKKKKPKAEVGQAQTEDPAALAAMPSAVREADRYLLAYNTAAASEALGEGSSDDNAWVATARGRVLGQDGDYEAAAAELRRAADMDTRNPAPTLFLGDTYAYDNKRGMASDAYSQAEARARSLLDSQPNDPDVLYFLGVAQQRQKRFKEAGDTLTKALSKRSSDSSILFQLGVTRFYQDEFQAAFDHLSQALDENSNTAYAYYYRGLAAAKLGRKDILVNDLDHFVDVAPNAPEATMAQQILASFK